MGYEKRIKQRSCKFSDIPQKSGRDFDIEVERHECAVIAERLKLSAINDLKLKGTIRKTPDVPIYHISGEVTAELMLCCAITGDDFAYLFTQELDWDISPDPHYQTHGGDASADSPEYVDSGFIDVVEFAVQTIGLNVPAYPRKDGADLTQWQTASGTSSLLKKGWLTFNEPAEPEGEQKHNPFAALADLQQGQE